MKCDLHPEADAIGSCAYCGRGVCKECTVRFNEIIYCGQCVAAGRIQSSPLPTPGRPPSQPLFYMWNSKDQMMARGPNSYLLPLIEYYPPKPKGKIMLFLFWIGIVGALICVISLVFVGSTVYGGQYIPSEAPFNYFAVGLFILSIGCFGIYWNYGCLWGLFGAITLPITGTILLLMDVIWPDSWPVTVIGSMVLVHLSISHIRVHLPIDHILCDLITLGRILNYIAPVIIIFTVFISLCWILYFAAGILFLDIIILILIPVPGLPKDLTSNYIPIYQHPSYPSR